MTAAHDDRSIVRAQQSLASIAYSTQGGRTLNRKQQRQRDAVVEAISVDTVMAEAITLSSQAKLFAKSPTAAGQIAELWEEKARERLVGSGIAASVLWALFYKWVLPMLLDWAKQWLMDQLKTSVSITTSPKQGRTSDR